MKLEVGDNKNEDLMSRERLLREAPPKKKPSEETAESGVSAGPGQITVGQGGSAWAGGRGSSREEEMGGGGGEEDGQGAASSHACPRAGPRSPAQGRYLSPVICQAMLMKTSFSAFDQYVNF